MSNKQALSGERIAQSDIDALHGLLERYAVPADGMSLEMLDGFLSALIVGPELVLPSEYWTHIWNTEGEWKDADEAARAHRLVQALWNDIVRRVNVELPDDDEVNQDPEAFAEAMQDAMPLLAVPESEDEEDPWSGVPEDYPVGAAWAIGFMRGVGLRAEAWSHWEQNDGHVAEDLQTIAELGLLDAEHAEEMGLDASSVPDLNDRIAIVSGLPVILQNFNEYRLEQLGQYPSDAPGPDDPCPCGSGHPFKRCCGSPGRLN